MHLNQAPFENYYSNDYGIIKYDPENKVGLCEATASYIPIEEFRHLFEEASKMIQTNGITHFIFDKRQMKAFHQPSMEWYFIHWKQSLIDNGLKHHYKILPNEPWFAKCVEAGKSQILNDHPENRLDEVSIQYVNDVNEVLKQLEPTAN